MFSIHAPAKVNLYLHVGPARADGRHPLDSLVIFADARAADLISFQPGGNSLDFRVTGKRDLSEIGADHDNLVLRAVRALENHSGQKVTGTLTLSKHLPIAAGIGGGSADAAATLLLMNSGLGLGLSADTLEELARPLGGDVPACVRGVPVLMRGDGDRVEPVTYDLPLLPAILVCPPIACPTGPVFRQFDQDGGGSAFAETPPPDKASLLKFLSALADGYQNDLQMPAITLHSEIGDMLARLNSIETARFVAMSGSGATCFAIFETPEDADQAMLELCEAFPDHWLVRTDLGKAGFDPTGFDL